MSMNDLSCIVKLDKNYMTHSNCHNSLIQWPFTSVMLVMPDILFLSAHH